MKTALITAFLIAVHLATFKCYAAETSSNESPVVATVIEKRITAADVSLQCDTNNKPIIPIGPLRNPLDELRIKIGREVTRDYIEKNNLKATDEEIREYKAFQDRFEAQDRIKRQKKLAELDKKLQDINLSTKEKEQAEKYRATLLSLASYDKRREERSYKPTAEIAAREIWGQWVETWKFHKSIYDKYGGAVVKAKFGPDPVGAMKCLLEDYEKQGKIVIHDENLRLNFWQSLRLPPKRIAKPEEIDFTPYWKKPLPEHEE